MLSSSGIYYTLESFHSACGTSLCGLGKVKGISIVVITALGLISSRSMFKLWDGKAKSELVRAAYLIGKLAVRTQPRQRYLSIPSTWQFAVEGLYGDKLGTLRSTRRTIGTGDILFQSVHWLSWMHQERCQDLENQY
jgi:hypothetical protein